MANGLEALITPVQAAISSAAGSATICLRSGHSGAASLSSLTPAKGGSVETIQTIDIFSVDTLLPSEAEIFVKIDVEGHEAVVIDQLMKSRHLPRIVAIFYEVNETWSDPAALEAALRKAGFSKFIRHGSGVHYDMLAQRGAPTTA